MLRDGGVGEVLARRVSRQDVRRALDRGRLLRLARAAYPVQLDPLPEPVPRRAQIRAAVLSLGPGAVACFETAAELHGTGGLPATRTLHVSVPGPLAKRRTAAYRVRLPPRPLAVAVGLRLR